VRQAEADRGLRPGLPEREEINALRKELFGLRRAAMTVASLLGGAMTKKKIWFITGAGRGMGVDFAKPPATRSSPRAGTPTPWTRRLGRPTTCWP
jgi:hypothetical protein